MSIVFSDGGEGWIRTTEGDSRQIYSLFHLAALEPPHILNCIGAGDWNRTHNLLITSQLLCQLSYASIKIVVPRGGIEPPTRGFSVPCSTD